MNKRLYKSRTDKAISGVCAGLADYMNLDVVVVRLLTVILCFPSFGTVLAAYIIAAIIIPEEPTVRMEDGTRKTVYETTYQHRNEEAGEPQGTVREGAEFHMGNESSQGQDTVRQEPVPGRKASGNWIIGVLLIVIGAYMILEWFFPWVSWRFCGAGLLIALGIYVLARN